MQVKIVRIGRPVPTITSVAFTTPSRVLDTTGFEPFTRLAFIYSAPDDSLTTYTVSASEMGALIDSVATVPAVAAGTADPTGDISLAFYNTVRGAPKVFESIFNRSTALTLFPKLLSALAGNAGADSAIAAFACKMSVLRHSEPANASGLVEVQLVDLRYNPATRQYVGTMRVKNTSGASLLAPLQMGVVMTGTVRLRHADAYACGTAAVPSGTPIVTVLAVGSLANGASASRTVYFDNPDRQRIVLSHLIVYSGAGVP
ncbi:MAG TPA: hypothetical protein VFK69_08995 [Candidatus Eisenbacteria bacterium]|nr:hypothetical protein [Candidatus Eisenbacteria bacterium]